MESAVRESASQVREYVHRVEVMKAESIMGFTPNGPPQREYLKISVALPKHVPTARSILQISSF
jgi:hypothetical protein